MKKISSDRRLALSLCLVVGLVGLACEPVHWGPDLMARSPRSAEETVLVHGREGYRTYCIGCHGENGDGAGPASRFLDPRPRDFRLGVLKFAAVESGELPHDSDFDRIIRKGLSGTSMSPWPLMPSEQRYAISQYIKTFAAGAYATDLPHPTIVPTVDPWEGSDEEEVRAIGKTVYHSIARCNSCHPSYATARDLYEMNLKAVGNGRAGFRENMYEPVLSDSDWGIKILPPDFLVATLRTGNTLDSLYRVIVSGVGGTAMPSWKGALPEETLWALVHYVDSLVSLRGTPAAAELRKRLAEQPAFVPPDAVRKEAQS